MFAGLREGVSELNKEENLSNLLYSMTVERQSVGLYVHDRRLELT